MAFPHNKGNGGDQPPSAAARHRQQHPCTARRRRAMWRQAERRQGRPRHRRSAASRSESAAGARTTRRETRAPAGQLKNAAPSRSEAGKSATLENPAHLPTLPIVTRRAKTTGLERAAHRAGCRQAAPPCSNRLQIPYLSLLDFFRQEEYRDIQDIRGGRMTATNTTFVWTGIANIAAVQSPRDGDQYPPLVHIGFQYCTCNSLVSITLVLRLEFLAANVVDAVSLPSRVRMLMDDMFAWLYTQNAQDSVTLRKLGMRCGRS